MKKLLILFVLGFSLTAFAQYKDSGVTNTDIRDGLFAKPSGSLFGFLNSDNFIMHQSYSLSYSTAGSQGMALGVYTNSMALKLSNNLNLQLDASVVNSPYSTLGSDFQKSVSGFYINRAAINYQPWKDVTISVQYSNAPYYYNSPFSYYGGYYNGFNSGFYDANPFAKTNKK